MRFARQALALLVTTSFMSAAFAGDDKVKSIEVASKAIQDGKSVPKVHTGDGNDVSPDLTWKELPAGTKTVAVTCEDPDAPGGTWFHWIVFNMSPKTTSLKEGMEKSPKLADGSMQGTNDFGKVGYNGPAPPKGAEHHYQYKVFAIDKKLGLKAGCDKKEFYDAITGHVLGRGQVTGLYKRP